MRRKRARNNRPRTETQGIDGLTRPRPEAGCRDRRGRAA